MEQLMSALGIASPTNIPNPEAPTTSKEPAGITSQSVLTAVLNELVSTRQAYAALDQKFQAMTMEPNNEAGATFTVKPFKGDKKEKTEEAISTWLGRGQSHFQLHLS